MKIYSNQIIPIYHFDMRSNIPIIHFEMKSGIQGVRSSVGSDQCAKIFVWNPLPAVQSSVWQRHSWHGLLLVTLYLNKGHHEIVDIVGAHHLDNDHLEVQDPGRPNEHSLQRPFTTYYYLPLILSETRNHFWHSVPLKLS